MESLMGRATKLRTVRGSLSESLEWGWKEKFPILVIPLDFKPQHKEAYKAVFIDEALMELVFNQQFRVYGLHAGEYELEPELKPFLSL